MHPDDTLTKAQELYFRQMRGPDAKLPSGFAADIIWDGLARDIQEKYYALARANSQPSN
jgi:hypothetical protein